jgi:hypothetical protein
MTTENVFEIQRRIGEVFKIHGQPTPQPGFGEPAAEYRQRVLSVAQHLLPAGHIWRTPDIRRQPERALDSIERALVHDRVAAFKAPVGPLREMTEVCARTGRVVNKFYGDTKHCWESLPGFQQPRRATFVPNVGRGKDSSLARAERAAAANEMALAYQALDAQRAADGLR